MKKSLILIPLTIAPVAVAVTAISCGGGGPQPDLGSNKLNAAQINVMTLEASKTYIVATESQSQNLAAFVETLKARENITLKERVTNFLNALQVVDKEKFARFTVTKIDASAYTNSSSEWNLTVENTTTAKVSLEATLEGQARAFTVYLAGFSATETTTPNVNKTQQEAGVNLANTIAKTNYTIKDRNQTTYTTARSYAEYLANFFVGATALSAEQQQSKIVDILKLPGVNFDQATLDKISFVDPYLSEKANDEKYIRVVQQDNKIAIYTAFRYDKSTTLVTQFNFTVE
ncbi:hypothetical protein CJJ23_00550 [Mycoplasmopsis agassizii]|uniref:Uncharacterized protein n=1 Tax=Mycoplasmopsis agassizii TaxID=33922 RepID=A0A269TJQ6_9BACT|nr:hypothetical protein [Mycoplasmopsis agassizii]PAK21617.1 hypothetical protein CJJ23_00550 [Mycoplasmopsis agassizii]